jgi:hypothetical protein
MANLGALKVDCAEVFPHGLGVVGEVGPLADFNASTKDNRVQARDKDTGLPMWQVEVLDFDPQAREKTYRVKIAGGGAAGPARGDQRSGTGPSGGLREPDHHALHRGGQPAADRVQPALHRSGCSGPSVGRSRKGGLTMTRHTITTSLEPGDTFRQVTLLAACTLCLWVGKPPSQLDDADFLAVSVEIDTLAAVSVSARQHARTRLFALAQICYQLGQLTRPARPAGVVAHSPAELAAAVVQPEIRRELTRHATTLTATLRPATVAARVKAVLVLCDYLAEHHPQVRRLNQLDRTAHIEPFFAWARHRPWRGPNGGGRTISLTQFHHDVVGLRVFFEDIACWGWASAPTRRLLFISDIPRMPEPLPRALTPDVDRGLSAAFTRLEDPMMRAALVLLRATGIFSRGPAC